MNSASVSENVRSRRTKSCTVAGGGGGGGDRVFPFQGFPGFASQGLFEAGDSPIRGLISTRCWLVKVVMTEDMAIVFLGGRNRRSALLASSNPTAA